MDSLPMERTAQDVFLGRLPLTLAGKRYVLPVLTTGQNAEWQVALDASLTPLLSEDAQPADLLVAMAAVDLLGFIYSYDRTGVLPKRETIEKDIYPHELLRSVQEVRLATNPTVAYGVALTLEEARAKSGPPMNREQRRSQRTSSSRPRTAGRTARSATT